MPIVWRDTMSVGDAMIDSDHRELIAIINLAEQVINQSGSRRDLMTVLDRLETYTQMHFAREEALQKRMRYPLGEAHKKEHGKLIATLREIRGQVEQATDPCSYEQSLSGLAELLRKWLIRHILDHDLRMRPYIQQMKQSRPNSERSDPLERAAAWRA
jgi:hemerythrin